jgi:PhzF family phenazine biosynthesis protein
VRSRVVYGNALAVFHVNAFTAQRFAGNPAAVCPLNGWLDDDWLRAVAAENNLSETAFLVPRHGHPCTPGAPTEIKT